MKVKEAMHKGAEWVPPDTPLPALAAKMRNLDVGAIPVGEHDHLIGIVTDRDITVRALPDGKDPARLTARDVMSTNVISCWDTDEVSSAAQIMESNRVRRLPVLNAKSRLVGMLSLGDISHAASPRIAAEVTKAVTSHHG